MRRLFCVENKILPVALIGLSPAKMGKLLLWAVAVCLLSWIGAAKEWKNFENGKVYSHKLSTEKNKLEDKSSYRQPVGETRLLHSHHKDKSKKLNLQQSVDEKPIKTKNAERHRKKNIEEEMQLKPLKERHHIFPNPALLEKSDDTLSSITSKPTSAQRRKKIRNGSRGVKKSQVSKETHKNLKSLETKAQGTSAEKISKTKDKQEQITKTVTPKEAKKESQQFQQRRKDGFAVKQTSYW